jgi:serine-type D-Ala-D-Ala carboxypeptidase/endopeptidase (penicillin-binding protein 4)
VARGLPSGLSNWTTFPIREVIMAAATRPSRLGGEAAYRNLVGYRLFQPQRMGRGIHKGALVAGLAALFLLPANAHGRGFAPDRVAVTPVAHAAQKAHKAVSAPQLRAGLSKLFRRVGKSGAMAVDAASGQVLFARKARRPRILASNSKLFTTSTALAKFGPGGHLHTTAWCSGQISNGSCPGLYLRGGGDPTLGTTGVAKLADRVRAAGITSVTGPLHYDDTYLDHVTGIPEHGISFESVGRLSGLQIDGGLPSDPARTAAQRFDGALRKDGISIATGVTPGLVVPGFVQIGDYASPTMADIVRATDVPSNNFLAEMLLKDVGSEFGESGSTAAGISVVRGFAAKEGARFNGENGSGLTRRNKASPASVVKLLDSMIEVDGSGSTDVQGQQEGLRDSWIGSLAVAGRSGTVAHRMRGTAAQGRCHLKTGTLDGVSALSGYCFRGGNDAAHAVIFSLLMNRVNVSRAHVVQDRMASLIARYRR